MYRNACYFDNIHIIPSYGAASEFTHKPVNFTHKNPPAALLELTDPLDLVDAHLDRRLIARAEVGVVVVVPARNESTVGAGRQYKYRVTLVVLEKLLLRLN